VGKTAGPERLAVIQEALKQASYADIPDARVEGAMAAAWKEWDREWEEECHTFGATRWIQLVLEELELKVDPIVQDNLAQAVAESGMEVDPPMVSGVDNVLPRLADKYQLGLICDTGLSPGWMLRQWMEAQGIREYFTQLTFSDELGVSKPHPKAFLSTLEVLNAGSSHAVHIGDMPRTDIAGAQSVGMRTIRFKGVSDWESDHISADAEITRYSELEPLLEAWQR
jgi:putative hydrolase of the HAD superfamily